MKWRSKAERSIVDVPAKIPIEDYGTQLDITGSKHVQIQIKHDGSVLWVNTAEENCVLRICQIESLELVDERLNNE